MRELFSESQELVEENLDGNGFRRLAAALVPISLGDGAGGALVDASAAVHAFACIDDGDVIAGDGVLGADVDACTACDTLGSVNCNHFGCLCNRSDECI